MHLFILWHIESTPSANSVQRNVVTNAATVPIVITEALEGDGAPAPAARLETLFQPAVPCKERRRTGATIFDILGRDVPSLVLARYDRQTWRDTAAAGDYITRIFGAVPEGGAPQTSVYWAESTPVLISGSLAFATGARRRVLIGNGYVHLEDESGCQWWARYLGPDKSQWVVPAFFTFAGLNLSTTMTDLKKRYPKSTALDTLVHLSDEESHDHISTIGLSRDAAARMVTITFEQQRRGKATYPSCEQSLSRLKERYGNPAHVIDAQEERSRNRRFEWDRSTELLTLNCFQMPGQPLYAERLTITSSR